MENHARDKDTAAWLSQEYGGPENKNLFVVRAGSPETTELPWSKVQRRIAQLIKEDRFFTEAERDNLDDIDPIAIRENLAQRGIVNGQVVEPEKLDNDPFIQQVMADVEQIAADEAEPRFSVVMTSDAFPDPEDAFAVWDNQTKGQSRPEAAIAKRERPSVLEGLKRPIPPRSMEKKPRQQEQEAR